MTLTSVVYRSGCLLQYIPCKIVPVKPTCSYRTYVVYLFQHNNNSILSQMFQLHIQSSGLKALCTDISTEGIEVCRRSCGGHGYMMVSGMCDLLTDQFAGVTVEGENTVLYLQVAR